MAARSARSRGSAPDTLQVGNQKVRFRYYVPGDEEQIAGVYDAAFDGFYARDKPVDGADYIRWFTERHGSHRVSMEVALIDSTIVGASGATYRTIKFGQRELYGTAGGIGTAVLPSYQRRGINRALDRWADSTEDPPRSASVATRRVSTRDRRKRLIEAGALMDVYIFVQHPLRVARGRGLGATLLRIAPAFAFAQWGRLRSSIGSRRPDDVTIETVESFDGRFQAFLDGAQDAWDIVPIRDIEYLNWRFCDARAGRFVVRVALQQGRLAGYSVLHQLGDRGHIVDLLALPGRLDVARALAGDAVRQFREVGTSAVECWMLRRHPYARVLRQEGFVRLRGRSEEVAEEVRWNGPGIGPTERAFLTSPATAIHLVRADFDGI